MFNIVGIDPGTNYAGYVTFTLDNDFNIVHIEPFLINLYDNIPSYHTGTVFDRLQYLDLIVRDRFYRDQPIQLAIEAGFINRFRPQAYGPIANAIYVIENAYRHVLGMSSIFEYPPKTVKATLITGNANKKDIYTAVSNIPELSKYLYPNISEHEVDAMAIGYTHILRLRKVPELLLVK